MILEVIIKLLPRNEPQGVMRACHRDAKEVSCRLPVTFQTNIRSNKSPYRQRHSVEFHGKLLLAMTIQNDDHENITHPSRIHDCPFTPPLTDEKQARDTRYILQQIAKYRSGDRGQTIYKVDKRVWATVNQPLSEVISYGTQNAIPRKVMGISC